MKNKKGNSAIVIGIVIFLIVIIVTIIIFNMSNSSNNTNLSNSGYKNDNSKGFIDKKEISEIIIDNKKYDLTKTLEDSGIEIGQIFELNESDVANFTEIEEILKKKKKYNENSDNSLTCTDKDTCNNVLIVKAGKKIKCWLSSSKGKVEIINNSDKDMPILKCHISMWSNITVNSGEYGRLLNGFAVGETTKEEVIKKYGNTVVSCKDGSSVKFSFHNNNDLGCEGKISYITINLKY